MLRASAIAAPVTAATQEAPPVSEPRTELARLEASLYPDDARPEAAVPIVAAPALETAPPRSNGSKKAGTRRRRGKK